MSILYFVGRFFVGFHFHSSFVQMVFNSFSPFTKFVTLSETTSEGTPLLAAKQKKALTNALVSDCKPSQGEQHAQLGM